MIFMCYFYYVLNISTSFVLTYHNFAQRYIYEISHLIKNFSIAYKKGSYKINFRPQILDSNILALDTTDTSQFEGFWLFLKKGQFKSPSYNSGH